MYHKYVIGIRSITKYIHKLLSIPSSFPSSHLPCFFGYLQPISHSPSKLNFMKIKQSSEQVSLLYRVILSPS